MKTLTTLVVYALAIGLPAVLSSRAEAQDVILRGRDFYLDGRPWLPKGVDVEAFNRPAVIPSAPKWMNDAGHLQGRHWWGASEIAALKSVFGATIVRITVSQPALDPQSSIYDPKYPDELLKAFSDARKAGLIVVVSMDAQAENGLPDLPCMPNDSTARAWKTLAPSLLKDAGVIFELFNEPCRANWDQGRKDWAKGMQPLIDMLRAMGAKNILLVDGLGYAQSTNDLFPLLHDAIPNRLALAVHPYFDELAKEGAAQPDAYFTAHFGKDADRYPIIATEWNATETNGCAGARTPAIALALMRYLQAHRIGLIGWGIDSGYGKLVKDHDHYTPTDYQDFRGCLDKAKGVGPSGGGRLLTNFPRN
ncbi:MAG: cellulase family glycosylhydrolase [Azospirillaceae bacterium]|nr:cellulase family glycosylhydrolase [Azospirillaceae bacterium]